jgi:hypothetical protein
MLEFADHGQWYRQKTAAESVEDIAKKERSRGLLITRDRLALFSDENNAKL